MKRKVIVELELAEGDGKPGVIDLAEKLTNLAAAVLKADAVRDLDDFKADGAEVYVVSRPDDMFVQFDLCAPFPTKGH